MDLKQLKTFVVLSKNKNYTRTANELGYAQSSISAQIQQLEQELNTKLLDRIGKKVFLTESGEQLLPYAIEMLALAATIRDKLDNDHLSGSRIVVGASESLCVFKLPAIVEAFRRSHPNIELHLALIENAQVVDQLTNNTIDVAFTIGNSIEHPAITSFLKKREELLVLSAPTHPLQSKKALVITDFANQPFLLTSTSCNYRETFEGDLKSHGVPYQVTLESGSVQAIKKMTISGLGLCVLPSLAVQEELNANLLTALPYKNDYRLYTQLFCHASKWLSPNLADFINLVIKSI